MDILEFTENQILPSKEFVPMPRVELVPIPTLGKKWYQRGISWATNRRQFLIYEDYITWCRYIDAYVKIPENFVMDFASVPKALHIFFNPSGILAIQAILHDCLYRFGNLIYWREGMEKWDYLYEEGKYCTRKFADVVFREHGRWSNGTTFLNDSAYYTLRLAGGLAFKPREIRNTDWTKPVWENNWKGFTDWERLPKK